MSLYPEMLDCRDSDVRDLPTYEDLRVHTGEGLRVEPIEELGDIAIKAEITKE